MQRLLFLLAFLSASLATRANVRLPHFFSNNMVLQRDHNIPVWGWADPNEKITVQLRKQTKTVTADAAGKWRIDLDAEKAGGPYALSIQGKDTIQIQDVLIGDVWICSGQSNMEMQIGEWGFINNYEDEIAAANYPAIRQFIVPKETAAAPQNDVTGGTWKTCNPENAAEFSAVAYFFARELNRELNIPIGLINTTWGGTHVETWTSKAAFESSDAFKTMISGMKTVDLQEFLRQKKAVVQKKIETLQGPSMPTPEEIAAWSTIDYNDANWHAMVVPQLWEQQDLEDFDGIVWLRKTIVLTAEDAGKSATLLLSVIDDNDDTYVNGEKVGSTSGYNVKRKYAIPAGLLKEGKNVIAVRIKDTGGGGGFWGDASAVKLSIGNKVLPLAGTWLYWVESIAESAFKIGPNSYPTLLSNAMLNPLIPYAITGVIWYQGEANAGRAYQYRTAFPLMINDWRNSWQQGDFPFYFVQLASFNSKNGTSATGSEWAELREAQALTLALPNTGMAVTTDIGDANDIHPKNKQDVGKRLAAIALSKTYGQKNKYGGPAYQSYKTTGNKVTLSFSDIGSGLMTPDRYGYLRGFEIAGADQKFHYAKAYIDGEQVIVTCDAVKKPVAVRYGWADDASDDNLYNKEGFPAAPFRTDNWKGITEGVQYGF